MKRNIILVALLAVCQLAFAVPAKPGTARVVQGDGSELVITLHGDEFFSYVLTEDGYHVTQHSDGNYYYYAPVITRSNVKVQAHRAGSRDAAERAFLSTISVGVDASYLNESLSNAVAKRTVMAMVAPTRALTMPGDTKADTKAETKANLAAKGLVIVVQYSDIQLTPGRTIAEFTNLLNQEGYSLHGGTGSARDYFKENSKGKYNPEFVICPQVITLPHPRAYYGARSNETADIRSREMIIDACTAADAYVNFSDYDTNGDGKVDNVFVYYAGYNEAEHGPAESIWPHRWAVYNTTLMLDGVQIYDYACTSELRSNIGTTLAGIGTFTHEFGHVLGLPDFYDTDGATNGNSPGLYAISVMCSGSYNNDGCTPPYYTAIERNIVDWGMFYVIKPGVKYELKSIQDDNDAYVIQATDDSEWYVLEARDGSKGWDKHLDASGGLLIYKVDQSKKHIIDGKLSAYDMWANARVNAVRGKECAKLIESSGFDVNINNGQDKLFYPSAANVTKFGPQSYGGVDSDHNPIGIELRNIAFAGGVVSFEAVSTMAVYPTISLSKSNFSVGDSFSATIVNKPDDFVSASWIIDQTPVVDGQSHTFSKTGKVKIVCKITYDDNSQEVITRIVNVN